MKNFIFLFLIASFKLSAIGLSLELSDAVKKTNSDLDLQNYWRIFDAKKYKVFYVKNLGYFNIDDVPDTIKVNLKKGIYWESETGTLVKKYTKKNTIAVDLGAHIGIYTIIMSKKVGKNGLVVAFEPQLKMFCENYRNLKLNDCLHNVALLRNACGDKEEFVEMNIRNPYNEGATRIGKGGDHVQMITLDSINLDNVSFIKMDIETSECKALLGARKTILKSRPVIVLKILNGFDLDNGSEDIIKKFHQILSYFKDIDYTVERIYGNDFIAYP